MLDMIIGLLLISIVAAMAFFNYFASKNSFAKILRNRSIKTHCCQYSGKEGHECRNSRTSEQF